MALNALKRLIKPRYRVVVEMSNSGAVYLQRKNVFGKWVYVCDVFGAIEFEFVRHAFAYIEALHVRRIPEVSMLVTFEGEL